MARLLCALAAIACAVCACSAQPNAGTPAGFGETRYELSDNDGQPNELAMVDRTGDWVLRLALLRPDSFDPLELVLTDQSAVIVADLLYDGLTEAVAGQKSLRPGLAERWEANEDFTEWTFHLSSEAAERGVSAATVVDALAPFIDGGVSARRGGVAAMVAAGLTDASAIDQSTVVLRLRTPNAGLPWVLSGLPFSVVGPDGNATGRYEVVSNDANGLYLRAGSAQGDAASALDDGVKPPDEVQITWAVDGTVGYEMLEQGAAHAAIVDPTSFEQARERYGATTMPTAATRFYVMNSRSTILSERSARLAVLAALDRHQLIEAGSGQQGSDVSFAPTDGLLAETIVGFDQATLCAELCRFDPETAAAVAHDLGRPRIRLAYAGSEQSDAAEAIVAQLASAGFATEASQMPPQELARVIVTGETDLFGFGWVAPATSSDAVIPALLTVDSPANIARVDSPAVAALLGQAAVTADDQRRWELLAEAHRAAMEQALIYPVATATSMLLHDPILDWLPVRADGSIDLEAPAIVVEALKD